MGKERHLIIEGPMRASLFAREILSVASAIERYLIPVISIDLPESSRVDFEALRTRYPGAKEGLVHSAPQIVILPRYPEAFLSPDCAYIILGSDGMPSGASEAITSQGLCLRLNDPDTSSLMWHIDALLLINDLLSRPGDVKTDALMISSASAQVMEALADSMGQWQCVQLIGGSDAYRHALIEGCVPMVSGEAEPTYLVDDVIYPDLLSETDVVVVTPSSSDVISRLSEAGLIKRGRVIVCGDVPIQGLGNWDVIPVQDLTVGEEEAWLIGYRCSVRISHSERGVRFFSDAQIMDLRDQSANPVEFCTRLLATEPTLAEPSEGLIDAVEKHRRPGLKECIALIEGRVLSGMVERYGAPDSAVATGIPVPSLYRRKKQLEKLIRNGRGGVGRVLVKARKRLGM